MTPKMKKLHDALEDIFGTVEAPVREIEVIEPSTPVYGDAEGKCYRHEFYIKVVLDSRFERPP